MSNYLDEPDNLSNLDCSVSRLSSRIFTSAFNSSTFSSSSCYACAFTATVGPYPTAAVIVASPISLFASPPAPSAALLRACWAW